MTDRSLSPAVLAAILVLGVVGVLVLAAPVSMALWNATGMMDGGMMGGMMEGQMHEMMEECRAHMEGDAPPQEPDAAGA